MGFPAPRAGRRLLAATLLALAAVLAAAASALGLSLPPPVEGDVGGPLRVQRHAEGAAFVTWNRYDGAARRLAPRAAALTADGTWAWADPEREPADPAAAAPERGTDLAVATDVAGDSVAVWRLNGAIRVARRPARGA